MNEVISSILQAEKAADLKIQEANEKSLKIIGEAEITAEKIKNTAVASFKVHRLDSLNKADKRALDEYDVVLKQNKDNIDKLISEAHRKVGDVSDGIVKNIIK